MNGEKPLAGERANRFEKTTEAERAIMGQKTKM
jgi:hypothetical protein